MCVDFEPEVALEWSHGQFSTLVELAWLNGIGGYGAWSAKAVELLTLRGCGTEDQQSSEALECRVYASCPARWKEQLGCGQT